VRALANLVLWSGAVAELAGAVYFIHRNAELDGIGVAIGAMFAVTFVVVALVDLDFHARWP
jgi:hypothetical protein